MKKISKIFLIILLIGLLISASGCGSCNHEWKEANCLEPRACQKCHITEGEALGHDWEDASCTQAKTCKRCGATEGEALGHDWEDASCEQPKTCKRCGATEGDPLGHDAPGLTCISDGVCQICGQTISALGHDWEDATCTQPKTCRRCGEIEGDALGHTTSNGKCQRCGIEVYETVTGSGDDVISDITLDNEKIYRVHFTHSGSGNFIVKLYDSQNNRDLLINEIGYYDGRVLINGNGPFIFEIVAGGEWTYTIEPIDQTAAKSFSGCGDDVTELASLSTGALMITHDGESNFAVKVYTTDGRDLLVNEIGPYKGKVMLLIPKGSFTMFEIIADGNWTIEPI